MISNELDIDPYRLRLAQRGRVQIPDFLQESAAERLRDCLEREVPWEIAQRADLPVGPPGDDQGVLQAAYRRALEGFEFVFDRYRVVDARRDGTEPDLILQVVLDFLNSQPFLDFIRVLTGDARIRMVSMIAARYRTGHFLNLHNDSMKDEDREFAYVINLSRDWKPDWGGLLQFIDNDREIVETFIPHWNSLSLFRVPQLHQVSLVSPWARDDRYSITGWFRRN